MDAQQIIEIVDARIRRLVKPSTGWGTVTGTSPLMVLLPGDVAAVPVGQVVGVSPSVGDRVLLSRHGGRWYATEIVA